jgi:hypothetical protein
MGLAGHVAGMVKIGDAYNNLVGKPEGKGPLGRSKRRWEVILEKVLGK